MASQQLASLHIDQDVFTLRVHSNKWIPACCQHSQSNLKPLDLLVKQLCAYQLHQVKAWSEGFLTIRCEK